MGNLKVGRYDTRPTPEFVEGDGLTPAQADGYSGWIEGTRNDGSRWIIWLDDNGGPVVYYRDREESGAVLGDPVALG